MVLKKNIAVSDNGFLFNPTTGDSYSLNATGIEFLKLLQKGKQNDEIIAEISAEFEIDTITVEKDLNDFKSTLVRLKLAE
ncbi:MAG: PqqD family protein [Salinivirgaceae bacterium]|nr:PqqD family protein [Salinivirgaceae bacterium]MDD4747232.1 PqqD family protein [Salinivirgaceae bacterium]MDY0279573.1 PqqD family protein [Salinivirgaceae bacterium]